jgi:hypothetical protein
MLYDPKWETKTKPTPAAPLSVGGLVAWLETQNPAAEYQFTDISHCLLARYFQSLGYRNAWGGTGKNCKFYYTKWRIFPLARKAFPVELYRIASKGVHTYGAALQRARTYL